jgi:hypothetical protein
VKSTTVCHSIFPGWYRVTRKAQIEGRSRSRSIDCANPAYAFARLDEWEDCERALATLKVEPQWRSKVKRTED